MDPSTSLIPYLNSSSLIVFGIAHVANVAQPMINNAFIKIKCFLFVCMFFDLNIIIFFTGGKLFLKIMGIVYTDKRGWCGKAGIAIESFQKYSTGSLAPQEACRIFTVLLMVTTIKNNKSYVKSTKFRVQNY